MNLVLTNCPCLFQNSRVIETGLSHFRKLKVTVMMAPSGNFSSKSLTTGIKSFFFNYIFRESLQKSSSQSLKHKYNDDFDISLIHVIGT